MKDILNVIFIGGLTNGRIVYDYLVANKYVNLLMTITYQDDFKGARHVPFPESEYIIKSGTIKGYEEIIAINKPDVIIVAGWSELIPSSVLSIPPMGCLGFHPAKLPYDRGRSVLAWQIEDGYTETALTFFKYSEYPDGGNILAQERIIIEYNDYINDILDKVDKATLNIMRAYFPLIRQGLIVEKPQNLGEGSFRRLRRAADSMIDWNSNTSTIYNKIRAISHPYPGACGMIDNCYYLIWRAEPLIDFPLGVSFKPGIKVSHLYDDSMIIKTRDGFLRVTEYEQL